MRIEPVFGFAVPTGIAGIAHTLLDPRQNWTDVAYDAAAEKLVGLFLKNFQKFGD